LIASLLKMKTRVNAGLNWAPEISKANIIMTHKPIKIMNEFPPVTPPPEVLAINIMMKTIVPKNSINKRIMLNFTIWQVLM